MRCQQSVLLHCLTNDKGEKKVRTYLVQVWFFFFFFQIVSIGSSLNQHMWNPWVWRAGYITQHCKFSDCFILFFHSTKWACSGPSHVLKFWEVFLNSFTDEFPLSVSECLLFVLPNDMTPLFHLALSTSWKFSSILPSRFFCCFFFFFKFLLSCF